MDLLKHNFDIRKEGDPILRTKCEEITIGFPETKFLVDKLTECMIKANGIGLAAPQVGLPLRIFVLKDGDEVRHFINPTIVDSSIEKITFLEGCLSIDNKVAPVERPKIINVTWLDSDFNKHDEELDSFTARIFQHENDHLDGILFTDYLV
jgi:peptide deformylase